MPVLKTSITGELRTTEVLNRIAEGSKSRFERRLNEDRPTVIVIVFYLYGASDSAEEPYFEWVTNTDLVFCFLLCFYLTPVFGVCHYTCRSQAFFFIQIQRSDPVCICNLSHIPLRNIFIWF